MNSEQADIVRRGFAERGLAVLIVEGDTERHHCFECDAWNEDECHRCDRRVAPRVWADLDKPCDRGCKDGWWWCDVDDGEHIRQRCTSPDCRDGHQVWELRTTIGRPLADNPGVEWEATRLVARVTVQVVPFVHSDDITDYDAPLIEVNPYGEFWLQPVHGIEAAGLIIHGEPVPGRDFGVVLREAK